MLRFREYLKETDIKPYRLPKYKDILRSFGYMETRSNENKSPNITEHSDDNGNHVYIHHGSTNWTHLTNEGKTVEGKGMNKLVDRLLQYH